MDRTVVIWLVLANVVALAVLHQRMSSMGYQLPFQDAYDHVLELAGIAHGAYEQCGLLNTTTFILTSSRVVFADGVRPGYLTIKGGKIAAVSSSPPSSSKQPLIDYGHAVISPGVIDVHVHLNEPGREDWEGMATGTAAAAAGGISTVMDMPLNSNPVTTTTELLQQKLLLARTKAKVNVGFWGGIVPGNAANHSELWSMMQAGAHGFKSFLSPSGIDDFPNVARGDVAKALPFLLRKGVPYFVHAEVVTPVESEEGADPRKYSTYLATRPPQFEQDAIQLLLEELAHSKTTPTRGFFLHIAHLGDASSLPALKVAKRALPVSVETCAHYLSFAAEDIPNGDTRYKCAPPLRDAANKQGLLQGVVEGSIDIVSSDHSPAPPGMKELRSGDFLKAWGGISGVQYLLPATWTALKGAGIDLVTLSHLLSTNPAHLIGNKHKGVIAPHRDADIVVWDPEAAADTTPSHNQHKHKITPYQDMPLKGRVLATYVGGHLVFDKDQGVFPAACGKPLRRHWVDVPPGPEDEL